MSCTNGGGDKIAYQAGVFDLNVMPVKDVTSKKKRTLKSPRRDETLRFVMPTFEVFGRKRRNQ